MDITKIVLEERVDGWCVRAETESGWAKEHTDRKAREQAETVARSWAKHYGFSSYTISPLPTRGVADEEVSISLELAAAAYVAWAKREHARGMWRALYRKIRFYRIELCPAFGQGRIALILDGDVYCYPASTEGCREAIGDLELCANSGIF